jgi:hypothetical protein
MSFETELVDHLLDESTFTALVGSRLHPQHAPDSSVTPYVAYKPIYSDTEYTQDADASLRYLVQFSIFSLRYSDVIAVRDVLMSLLSGFTGTIDEPLVSLHEGTRLFFEGDTQFHHCAVSFNFLIPR